MLLNMYQIHKMRSNREITRKEFLTLKGGGKVGKMESGRYYRKAIRVTGRSVEGELPQLGLCITGETVEPHRKAKAPWE